MQLLIIADPAGERESIVQQLRHDFDLQLTEAFTEEAFRRALEQETFDVALIDYPHPWTTALQTLREIQARFPLVPVLMVIDPDHEEQALEGMRTGLSDYLLRPHLGRLPVALRSSLERARLSKAIVPMAARAP